VEGLPTTCYRTGAWNEERILAVTIYDVAKRAGVGIGTVSRAINNSPNINPTTKERILKIAEELNYQPHALAQGLARRKTFTIASVVPFFTNYFFMELLKSIQKALTRYNYDLILYSVDRMNRQEESFKRVLTERRVDGVLILSLNLPDYYADRFLESNIPVVIVDNMIYKIDSIAIANREAAHTATQHLINLGHTRIGMINGHLSSFPAILRLEGFKRALAENDIPFNDERLIICDATKGEHGFNERAGYFAMKRMMELGRNMPTAIFVASDVQALGVMRAAKEAGIRIPDDIAIVGFDDIEVSEFVGLTTMHQPISHMGQLAVDRLVQRIDGEYNGAFHKELQAELIVRETCGSKKSFTVHQDSLNLKG